MPALFLGAAVALAAVTAAAADTGEVQRREFEPRQLTSRWLVVAGGSLNAFNTRAAWAPKGLAGAAIVLEDVLGLDEENGTAFLRVTHRFNGRHSIQLAITDLERTASKTIDADIEWGDYVFRAEGEVSSELDTRIVNLKWMYDFSDSDRLNAGFVAGLSTFDIGLTLRGEARLESDEGDEWVTGVVEGADVVAPVPVLGFFVEYAMSPRFLVRFGTEALDLSLGDHRGRVLQTDLALEYAVNDLFGLGVGLGGIDLEYASDEGDERFGIAYRITSVSAYASIAF
jgi:hypothetical protein